MEKEDLGMDSDEPVPFSEFGLKGSKDRHLRYVLSRLGNPHPDSYSFDTTGLARIWLSHLHGRWDSLDSEVKSHLVADLLDVLYRKEGAFDDLFEILFLRPDQRAEWQHTDYSSTAENILRFYGLEHSFRKHEELQNIFEFPFKRLFRVVDPDFGHVSPARCCFCYLAGRPLYAALLFGRPDLVRLLLNCGARMLPDEFCAFNDWTGHPMAVAADIVFFGNWGSEERETERDVLSLELFLVDATASLYDGVRCRLWDAVEEIPSLKHMARACVRRHLRDGRNIGLADALRPCGLPKCLESYIYMEDVVVDA